MKLLFLLFLMLSTSICFAKKIIFLGDSLTEGYGISQEKAFPKLIENELKKKYPKIVIVNAGSSGSTSASAVPRLKWLLKSKPDILVLALGGNDGLRGVKLESTEKNLQQAIDLSLKNNVKIILAGVRIPTNYGKKYRASFEQLYQALAKKNKLIFIPYILKGVAGIKKLNLPDGIHPNESGHQVIKNHLLPTIKSAL